MDTFTFRVIDRAIAVTVGNNKNDFPLPQDFVMVGATACLKTPQATGQDIKLDITKDGVSALVAPMTISSGLSASQNAAQISAPQFARLSRLGVSVLQIGDGTAAGLDVIVSGYQPAGVISAPVTPPSGSPSGTWTTIANPSFTFNSGDPTGYDFRMVLSKAAYPSGLLTGSKVRITFKPATTAGGISAAYVGHVGASAPSFVAMPVQVMFGGVATATLIAGGPSVVSDDLAFTFDKTKDLVIAFQVTGSVAAATSASNWMRFYKGASGESGNQNVTGYSTDALHMLIEKVEIFS